MSASREREGLLVALAAVAVRTPFVLLSDDRLVTFVADDFHYYDQIARALAAGASPHVSAGPVTNGFQPMWGVLLATIHAVLPPFGPDAAARASVALQLLFSVAAALLIHRGLSPVFGRTGALAGSLLWALAPFGAMVPSSGTEAGLYAFLLSALLCAWTSTTRARPLALALVCAVLPAVRLDAWAFVAAVSFVEFLRRGARGLVPAVAAVLVNAPWIAWSALALGTPFPESGAAIFANVHFSLTQHAADDRPLRAAVAALGAVGTNADGLAHHLGLRNGRILVAALLAGVVGCLFAPRRTRLGTAVVAFLTASIVTFLFYALVLGYGQSWYFVPAALSICILAGALAEIFRPPSTVALALVLAASAVGWWNLREAVRSGPYPHQRGFLAAARQLANQSPADARIAAFNSGIASAYSNRATLNLDGVVNGRARAALRERALQAYLDDSGVTHLTDQPFVLRYFEPMGLDLGRWRRTWQADLPLPDEARPAIYERVPR